MADLTPTTATDASALDGTERIPCTQGGLDRALTPAQIKTALENGGGTELSLTGLTGFVPTQVSFLAADVTNATATMATTGLTVPVVSGQKYTFRVVLHWSDDVDLDGAAFDFDTSAAATNFRAFGYSIDAVSVVLSGATSTALASDFTGSATGTAVTIIEGSYEPSASGNFLVRLSQNAHTTGTLTLFRGSYLEVKQA